jgi:hypothetical protein
MIGVCSRAALALVVSGALLLGAAAPVSWVSTASAAVKKKPAKKAPRKKPAPKKKAARKKAPKRKKVVTVDVPPLPPGRTCYRAPSEVPEPPLLKSAEIELPDTVKGGALKSALLVYDVTIDKSGHISEVKTVGAPPKAPPWPQLHEAAIEALKQYRYAKTVVRRAAAPVCLLVSLNIDLRSEAE